MSQTPSGLITGHIVQLEGPLSAAAQPSGSTVSDSVVPIAGKGINDVTIYLTKDSFQHVAGTPKPNVVLAVTHTKADGSFSIPYPTTKVPKGGLFYGIVAVAGTLNPATGTTDRGYVLGDFGIGHGEATIAPFTFYLDKLTADEQQAFSILNAERKQKMSSARYYPLYSEIVAQATTRLYVSYMTTHQCKLPSGIGVTNLMFLLAGSTPKGASLLPYGGTNWAGANWSYRLKAAHVDKVASLAVMGLHASYHKGHCPDATGPVTIFGMTGDDPYKGHGHW